MMAEDVESEASEALARFAARYEPGVAADFLACVERLRARMPGAEAMIYDNYNALVVGFAPGVRASEAILSVAAYPRWCTLFFAYGATLDDPDGLLVGAGSRVRSIRLAGPARLDDPPVAALIDAALTQARVTIPPGRNGRLMVKSVSAKQRPRRP